MIDNLLVRRYAKALFDFAKQNGSEDRVLDDLRLIDETKNENRELRAVMMGSVISSEQKANIIRKLFGQHICAQTMQFAEMLISKRRESVMDGILEQYVSIYNEEKNINVVTITSVVPLNQKTQDNIVALFRAKTEITGEIQIKNEIDKGLIGGVVVNYLDYRYDASIRSIIAKMRKTFEENLYVKGF